MPDMSEENLPSLRSDTETNGEGGVLVRVASIRILRNGLQIATRQAAWPLPDEILMQYGSFDKATRRLCTGGTHSQ